MPRPRTDVVCVEHKRYAPCRSRVVDGCWFTSDPEHVARVKKIVEESEKDEG